MVIEQIVDIPASRRITIDVPPNVPEGKNILVFKPIGETQNIGSKPLSSIEHVRQLLQKEMAEKGTLAKNAKNGDGWEAHVRENYA
jgi:hypothetical protein